MMRKTCFARFVALIMAIVLCFCFAGCQKVKTGKKTGNELSLNGQAKDTDAVGSGETKNDSSESNKNPKGTVSPDEKTDEADEESADNETDNKDSSSGKSKTDNDKTSSGSGSSSSGSGGKSSGTGSKKWKCTNDGTSVTGSRCPTCGLVLPDNYHQETDKNGYCPKHGIKCSDTEPCYACLRGDEAYPRNSKGEICSHGYLTHPEDCTVCNPPSHERRYDLANEFLRLMNSYRSQQGLGTLKMLQYQQEYSMKRAEALVSDFSHNRHGLDSSAGCPSVAWYEDHFYDYDSASGTTVDRGRSLFCTYLFTANGNAEIICKNSYNKNPGNQGSAEMALNQFQNSPDHDRLMLEASSTYCGVGVYKDGFDVYYCVNFYREQLYENGIGYLNYHTPGDMYYQSCLSNVVAYINDKNDKYTYTGN